MKVLENGGVDRGHLCGTEEDGPEHTCFRSEVHRLQAGRDRAGLGPACTLLGCTACQHISLCHIF